MLSWLLLACTNDKVIDSGANSLAWSPEIVCPGDANCSNVTGELKVGAAAQVITPTCFEQWEDLNGNNTYKASQDLFLDCGCDQLCPDDEGYTGPDEGEGDGEFQAIWLAGYNNARPANTVHDDLWARSIVFEQGDLRLAVISVDLVGMFNDDIQRFRDRVASEGMDLDYIVVTSTHLHSGPDVLGQWGRQPGTTGRNAQYMEQLEDQLLLSLQAALMNLQPVTMKSGAIDVSTYSEEKGSRNILHDHRDPKIIDRMMNVALFENSNGEVVASMLNFGNHPEVLTGDSLALTSDFNDALRRGVENGITYPTYQVEGIGGVCVYISAAVGGMMSPLRVEVTDGSGNHYSSNTFEKSDALGNVMAELALQGLQEAQLVENPNLGFYKQSFELPVENILFQAAFVSGMFERSIENYEDGEMIDPNRVPMVRTEINVLDIGNIRMQTIPGELLPELAIGGYTDAAQPYNSIDPMVRADNPNPPDLTLAPTGPYIKDLMNQPYNWIVGLGNDELGYLIPPYNYKLDERSPYFVEADGDHYEETNSLGPSAFPIVETEVTRLLEWINNYDR